MSFLHVGMLTFPAGWSAPAHRHPFTEILILTQGRMAVQSERWSQEVEAGEIVAYPPDLSHRERSLVPGSERLEMILLSSTTTTVPEGVVPDVNGRVRTLARWMIEEYGSSYPDRQALVGAWFDALEAELRRLVTHRAPDMFHAVRRFMRSHLRDAHDVEDLARRCHLSRFHFIRTYRRATGRTPMEDLRQMRLEAACDLLLTTDWPLKRVAGEVGFCDEYYFSRAFKRHMHVSPGTFRKRA